MRIWSSIAGALWFACVPHLAQAASATWSGFYFGANLGWASAGSDWDNLASTAAFVDTLPPAQFSERMSGGLGGVQVGYGLQSGPFVYGVEALVNGSLVDGESLSSFGAADDRFELKMKALLAATGRLGYAWDNALFYVKGGVAAALLNAIVTDTGPPTTGSGRDRRWRIGPTLGVGVEYALTQTISLGLEYNYVHLSDANFELGDATGTYLWNVDVPDLHWVAARLNFRMN